VSGVFGKALYLIAYRQEVLQRIDNSKLASSVVFSNFCLYWQRRNIVRVIVRGVLASTRHYQLSAKWTDNSLRVLVGTKWWTS
jgi:hypothetical protein